MNSKSITLTHTAKVVDGTVQLTGSKSESNRALIIQALSQHAVQIENLSEAADTVTMRASLALVDGAKGDQHITVDIGPAGTAMRFLTSYLNLIQGSFTLTGTARMQQRPIGILVDALQGIGASISYEKQDGFPPLHIKGGFDQQATHISIQGDVSSQYISSLLLIAASLKEGLTLNILGELTSRPYVTCRKCCLDCFVCNPTPTLD